MSGANAAAKIRNLGPKSAAWLRQVGIRTHDDIVRLGAVEAFMKVKRAGFKPSLNLLYALDGAIADCHWAELPEERKSALLMAAQAAEAANPIKTRWQKQAERSDGTASHSRDTAHSSAGFLDESQPGAGIESDERASNRFD